LKLSGRVSPSQNIAPVAQISSVLTSRSAQSATTSSSKAYAAPVKNTIAPKSSVPAKQPRTWEEALHQDHSYVPYKEDYVPGKGVKLVELKERMCRWPMGDPKDENFRFCGCETVPGLPYCEHHARIAFQANTRSKLRVEELAKIDGNVIRKSAS
jgi:GcrA cell cycle regulator